jgi:hypothetical protein
LLAHWRTRRSKRSALNAPAASRLRLTSRAGIPSARLFASRPPRLAFSARPLRRPTRESTSRPRGARIARLAPLPIAVALREMPRDFRGGREIHEYRTVPIPETR